MKQVVNQIKNYIQLHTSDMETESYVNVLREIAEWATGKADAEEYGIDDVDLSNED